MTHVDSVRRGASRWCPSSRSTHPEVRRRGARRGGCATTSLVCVAVAGRAGVPCTAGSPRCLPEWIDTERYAIAGTIPDGVPVSALPALMTNLLKDRFRMVSHTEIREMPIYNLVLTRSDKRLGPSLKETSAECRAAMEARLAAPQRGASPPSAPTVSGGRASTATTMPSSSTGRQELKI